MPRAFIAIPIGPSLLPWLRQCSDAGQIADKTNVVRWANTAQFHLTLNFIGECPLPQLHMACDLLGPALVSMQPFDIFPASFSQFPSRGLARVLYAGVVGGEQLPGLANTVRQACRQAQVSADPKPFAAHITLGRIRNTATPQALATITAAVTSASLGHTAEAPLGMRVKSVTMFLSDLRPSGPVHTVLCNIPLAANSAAGDIL